MTLKAPFTGPIFDQMFAEAVDTVTSHLLTAYTQITGGELASLQDAASSVMSALIQAIGFDGYPGYNFNPGADNSRLILHVSQLSGIDQTLTETIVMEIYTDDANGEIPHWFGNIAQVIAQSKAQSEQWKALQPSFLQRVAGTIVAPLGFSGAQAILLLEIGIAIVALIAVAYVWRSFK